MAKTYNFTENELRAALALVTVCLNGMGGKRPADLEQDEYTWIDPEDLIRAGWSRFEAAGTWSALDQKGAIMLYETKNPRMGRDRDSWVLQTSCWQYLETVWDSTAELRQNKGAISKGAEGSN